MLCECPKVVSEGVEGRRPVPEGAAVQMPHENFEIVLQEACIQHKSVESMKPELGPAAPSRATELRLNRAEVTPSHPPTVHQH
ncbi:hypothetical protein QR680_012583 [Steinernema hermaphroditum]|uniref:Uncharacterized protein n=1 Tax=Steinernema hermaphroditum TaxID=289476 RepID=A0AA39M0Z7_9BILA|nr:hypothetical protein QR680_012583 [Steinernema hermaphroditum]